MSDKRKPSRTPFRGIERPLPQRIAVVSEATAEATAAAIVCLRLFDAAPSMHLMPPSDIVRCSQCGERVIVSKTAPKSLPRICMQCYQVRPESTDPEGESVLITPTVIRETIEGMQREAMGVPIREAERPKRLN